MNGVNWLLMRNIRIKHAKMHFMQWEVVIV